MLRQILQQCRAIRCELRRAVKAEEEARRRGYMSAEMMRRAVVEGKRQREIDASGWLESAAAAGLVPDWPAWSALMAGVPL